MHARTCRACLVGWAASAVGIGQLACCVVEKLPNSNFGTQPARDRNCVGRNGREAEGFPPGPRHAQMDCARQSQPWRTFADARCKNPTTGCVAVRKRVALAAVFPRNHALRQLCNQVGLVCGRGLRSSNLRNQICQISMQCNFPRRRMASQEPVVSDPALLGDGERHVESSEPAHTAPVTVNGEPPSEDVYACAARMVRGMRDELHRHCDIAYALSLCRTLFCNVNQRRLAILPY